MKKLIAGLCCASLLFGAAAQLPQGYTDSGIYAAAAEYTYQNFKYELLSDGTAAITGYTGSLSKLQIPSALNGKKVTKIADSAFSGNEKLTSVTIPSGVRSIGGNAFENCVDLADITISMGVTGIGDYAFGGCESIKSIEIPNSVLDMGDFTFWGCSGLEEIVLSKSLTEIGDHLFAYCKKLKTITIPDGVESIGSGAFMECSELESVDIPDSLTTILSNSFASCKALKSITIPAKCTNVFLENHIFDDCDSLAEINVARGNSKYTSIGGAVYTIDRKTLVVFPTGKESAALPSGVTTIGNNAFYSNKALNSVTMPESVTSIGKEAFLGCTGLESITIGSGVKTIGEEAFVNCSSLKTITIPKSVTMIKSKGVGYDLDFLTYTKNDDLIIRGYKSTIAQQYAKNTGITFIDIDAAKKGDVNFDGAVGMADLTRLQQYLAQWDVKADLDAAEVTGDNKLTMADLTRLQQYLANWDVKLG